MKRHNIVLAVWCAVLSLAVFSGCTEKELYGVMPEEGGIILVPEEARKVSVKSITEPSTVINDVWVIQLDGSGNVLGGESAPAYFYGPAGTPTGIRAFTEDNVQKYAIYVEIDPQATEVVFVANTGNSSLYTGVTTKADVEGKTKAISGEASLEGNAVMSGTWRGSAGGEGEISLKDVHMRRAFARINFRLKMAESLPEGEAFALTSVQLMNVPNVLHPYRDAAKLLPTDGTDVPFYPAATGTYLNYPETTFDQNEVWADDENLQWMPTEGVKGELLTTAVKEFDPWYVPENGRGTGSAANQRLKDADHAPEGQGKYATYVRVQGYYRTTELVNMVTYTIYLGEDNSSSYNIVRNTDYTVTVTIEGQDRFDTRISKEEEDYEQVNYIDYTDNSSPWFIVAALQGGQQNPEAVSAPEGWSIPKKEEMMLIWVYDAAPSQNFYWIDETQDNSRWYGDMGMGEIKLSAQGNQSATFYLLAIKSDLPVGFKYPYVKGGKGGSNIIVSRDANGGVTEDRLRPDNTAEPPGTYDEKNEFNAVPAMLEVALRATEPATMVRRTWTGAKDYCSTLTEGGHDDWRLPTQRELMMIYAINGDLQKEYSIPTQSWGDGVGAAGGHDELDHHIYYWTGTADATMPGNAWSVCFCHDTQNGSYPGKVEGYGQTYENFVRCVRDYTE
ncbi:MAG: DUF4906 domain-containing protein [bacterium]|uniref:DUF4906 domain-containing protein n=1 Tax=Candidatus Aphodosoma intestinipullorum TaxID=2840674 RepID=A0A940DIN5_9BACT|nr:DUF4906 domain-containing protein [Candidatus Aphodosoma intestinipullorum]